MFISSRKLFLASMFLGLCCGTTVSRAAYPDKPVMMVVPFAAGGSTDMITRAMQKPLAEALGANVIVKNTAGAGGTIGLAEVANAKPDGYTVGMGPVGPLTTQPHLKKLPYGVGSFEYVCLLYSSPTVLVTRKDSAFNSLQDVVDDLKKNPGNLTFAVPAIGSMQHIGGLQLAKATGTDIAYLPVRGDAPALQALLNGTADVYLANVGFVSNHLDQLKALAAFQSQRIDELPDLPTAKEAGYDLDVSIWGGLVVPDGTPEKTVDKLDQACHSAVMSDAFKSLMKKLHQPSVYMNHAKFTDFVKKQYQQNGELLEKAGLSSD